MSVEYVKFERKMELTSGFSTDYDYGDERQVMYVLDIPSEHDYDFARFLEGKYSLFSDDYKKKILKFWDIKDTESVFYGALYANDAAKENSVTKAYDSATGEYWPKPVLSREIYMNPN